MKIGDLRDKRVSVIGAGISGEALARLARKAGCRVFVSDGGNVPRERISALEKLGVGFELGGHTDRVFEGDLLVLSSGISPSSPVVERARSMGMPTVGEVDFVFPFLGSPVVGVTGSNGKTTTTSILGHVLNAAGVSTAVAGNIGNPLGSVPLSGETPSLVVAELSSFQLHWCEEASFAGGVVTNLAPDHIDWHGSYENYVLAKRRLIERTGPDGFAVVQLADLDILRGGSGSVRLYPLSWDKVEQGVHLDDAAQVALLLVDGSVRELFRFDQVRLLGRHNLENAAMALCAANLVLNRPLNGEDGRIGEFMAPPHRCELVGRYGGVTFVDDSKGTNVAATVTALRSLKCDPGGTKVILLGGRGKGEDYQVLAQTVSEECSYAVLYGEEGDRIAEALSKAGFNRWSRVGSLDEAVRVAFQRTKEGDMILLSPACTSWDQYPNYKERGYHFRRLAQEVGGRVSER